MENKKIEGIITEALPPESGETNGRSWTLYKFVVNGLELSTFHSTLGDKFKKGDDVIIDYTKKPGRNEIEFYRTITRMVLKSEDFNPEDVLSKKTLDKLKVVTDAMDKNDNNVTNEKTYNDAKEGVEKVENMYNNIVILDGKKYKVTFTLISEKGEK